MAETSENRRIFSLLEVTTSIQKTLADRYKSMFWVKAEMNKLNYYPHSGHCYPDLVEKKDGRVVAQLRSTLWKDDYNRITRDFLRIVKMPLQDGIQMLFLAKIMFDPSYGLSLRIVDIDPTFSLGEIEREKQETMERLKKEGIFSLNKALSLPVVPRRIAVISVQTSKGYADFINVIESSGFQVFHMLFPSLLQGDRAVDSILYQLKRIRHVLKYFDAVAIIRGGGGEVGLSCFNNYTLAKEVASFPIPVITGIGHATNETVTELVAHRNAITPTDLANFLLSHFRNFDLALEDARKSIVHHSRKQVHSTQQHLRTQVEYFRVASKRFLQTHDHLMVRQAEQLTNVVGRRMDYEKQSHRYAVQQIAMCVKSFLQSKEQLLTHFTNLMKRDVVNQIDQQRSSVDKFSIIVRHLDPQNILSRGYSLTLKNGRAVTTIDKLEEGDEIITLLPDGKVNSKVLTKEKSS